MIRGIESERLVFERLSMANVASFHELAVDEHVRRFLLDGEIMAREWSVAEVAGSDELFESHGVGLWLLRERDLAIGFAGFRVFEGLHDEPELLYALREEFTGRGLATEAAVALVQFARKSAGFDVVVSAVDEPNRASSRVLEKLGFRVTGSVPGAFGATLLYELSGPLHTA